MKKFTAILMAVLIIFCASGCLPVEKWEFSQSTDNIVAMRIINATEKGVTGDIVANGFIEVIAEIKKEHFSEIIEDVYQIGYQKYIGDPYFECVGVGILIIYENGDYDILNEIASTRIKYNNGEWSRKIDFKVFHNEFDDFINKWLEMYKNQ